MGAIEKINKYGIENCAVAYEKNLIDGWGASSIALEILPAENNGKNFTTRQVDSMIDAWVDYKTLRYNELKLVKEIS